MSFGEDISDLVQESTNGLHGAHSSWERVRAGEIASLVNGFAFRSEWFSDQEGTPILRIRDIVAGEPGTFYRGPVCDPKMTYVENGQIAIGMDGDFNSRLWNGGRALLNQRVCTLKADERFYSQKFLSYVLPGYLETINAHTSSVTVKHLSSRTVLDIPLPLPPLSEQRRIVEKIETLFARLDHGEAALRKVQELLLQYRQSVLKAAAMGQLTADWRSENAHRLEPGRDLLTRILQARRDTWQGRGKYQEPIAPDTSDLPELPVGWVWATAEQLCEYITKGTTPRKGMDADGEKTIPFIRVTNLTDSGRLDLSDKVYVSEAVHRGFLARSAVYPGDVLMNIVGPPLGQVSVVTDDYPEWNINQAIAVFRALPGMSSGLMCIYLLTMVAQDWLRIRAKTTAGQSNLTLEVCRTLPVPLPPVVEQDQITSAFAAAAERISELEIAVLQGLEHARALRQSILRDAFAGRLVPQDPNDEPAVELLARIRADRRAAPRRDSRKKVKA